MSGTSCLFLAIVAAVAGCGCGNTAQAQSPSTPRKPTDPTAKYATRQTSDGIRDARRFLKGDGVARDRAKAYELYRTSCEHSDPSGCIVLIGASGVSSDTLSAALDTLVKLCGSGDLKSCRAPYPGILVNGNDDWLADACSKGLAIACTKAGDPVKGCKKGDPDGCFEAAEHDAQGAQRWRKQGIDLLRNTCQQGIGLDCAALADLYRDKFAGLDDDAMMQRLTTRANKILLNDCRAADIAACGRLFGNMGRQPTALELEAHLMACYLQPSSCLSLAERCRNFNTPDISVPRVAYEIACFEGPTRRRADACFAGAKLFLEDAPTVGADPQRADAMTKRACELGNSDACVSRTP